MASKYVIKMEWQHYNNIKSTMWYIEKLLHEIETSLEEKELTYNKIEIDLTKEQIKQVKKQLKEIYQILKKAKKDFNLEPEPLKLSRIIDTNTAFIWKTIEDSWSFKIEKKAGNISSDEKKKNIDELLKKIMNLTINIRNISKN